MSLNRKLLVLLLAIVALAVVSLLLTEGRLNGTDEELPYSEPVAARVPEFRVTHETKMVSADRALGCFHRRYTMHLTWVYADRDYWRFWQDTYWCTGFGTAPRSHRFTADHWSNGSPDNFWVFQNMYDPVRSKEWVGKPRRLMFKSTARGKFQWCITRFGCIRTIEPWVKSRVIPNIRPDGYYYGTGGG